MNLIDLLKNQLLSPEILGKLASMVGLSREDVEKALNGGIPAILAIILKMTGSQGGLGQLTSALDSVQGLSPDALGKAASSLDEAAVEKGDSVLGSLLGSGKGIAIAMMLAKLLGIDSKAIGKLLKTLAPLILGVIADQWKKKGGTPAALNSLMSEQKSSIEASLPKGLSMADIPDLSAAADAGSSMMKKLLPLAALLVFAYVAYSNFGGGGTQEVTSPEAPSPGPSAIDVDAKIKEATEAAEKAAGLENVTGELTKTFGLLTETLNGVKDAATAESALPKITEIGTGLDSIKALADKLPDKAKETLAALLTSKMGDLTALIEKILGIPGVGEKIKPALDIVLSKLTALQS